jgi:energy-coupling factor transporter ATP-binding protein EcfA2
MLANYKDEQTCFLQLLDDTSPEQIMLLHGDSGTGKTTLVNHCIRLAPKDSNHVPIQMRRHAVDVIEILHRITGTIGKPNFPIFAEQIMQFQQTPTINVGRNILWKDNDISVALDANSPNDREYRLTALTDSLFDDVDNWGKQLLFVFDTYEDAEEDTQAWISGPFLTRVARSMKLRALIAGQKVPDNNNIEWGSKCGGARRLYGVKEAKHWLPVVEAMNRVVPHDPPLIYMAGICHAHRGNPAKIKMEIESFPMRNLTS